MAATDDTVKGRSAVKGSLRSAVTEQIKTGTASGGTRRVSYVDASGERQTGVAAEETPAAAALPSYTELLGDYYEQSYRDALEANRRALESARTANEQQTRTRTEALNGSYDAAEKQLYRDYMDSLRTLPGELNLRGYTGGLSESARLRLDTAYGEELNKSRMGRASELSKLLSEAQALDVKAQQTAAEADEKALQQRYTALAALQKEQYERELSDARSRAAVLADAGDFSGYLSLGYTPEQVDYLRRVWLARNPKLAA